MSVIESEIGSMLETVVELKEAAERGWQQAYPQASLQLTLHHGLMASVPLYSAEKLREAFLAGYAACVRDVIDLYTKEKERCSQTTSPTAK